MHNLKKYILNEDLNVSTIFNILKNSLKIKENIEWVNNELNGYKDVKKVPSYRIIETTPIFQLQKGSFIINDVADDWEKILEPFKDIIEGNYEEVLDLQKNYRIVNSIIEIDSFQNKSYISIPINIVRAKTTAMRKEEEASLYGDHYGAISGKYSVTKSQVDIVKNSIRNEILVNIKKESKETQKECESLIYSFLFKDDIKPPLETQINNGSMVII